MKDKQRKTWSQKFAAKIKVQEIKLSGLLMGGENDMQLGLKRDKQKNP